MMALPLWGNCCCITSTTDVLLAAGYFAMGTGVTILLTERYVALLLPATAFSASSASVSLLIYLRSLLFDTRRDVWHYLIGSSIIVPVENCQSGK